MHVLFADLVYQKNTDFLSALLAKSGVLDNHKATSNKLAFEWVMEQGTKVEWIKKARWVDDNNIITSSGISAGIDMSLYVIAKLYGDAVRNYIAKKAEKFAYILACMLILWYE